jgi:exodeoxyribonuclease VII large subunit
MLNTLRRRYPLAEVVIAPTPVQGIEAPGGIVAAIQRLCRHACPDVILVARGGGSIEDLWAFNEEVVARAIVAAIVPVISGVGHETDFTIADFVADLRAPTPTAAAELATPNIIEDMRSDLENQVDSLVRSTRAALEMPRWDLSEAQRRLQLQSPLARLRSDRQRLDDLSRRAGTGLERQFERRTYQLKNLEQRLETLDPEAVLRRGFAIVTQDGGQPIRSVTQVKPDQPLKVRVSDGSFGVRVQGNGSHPELEEPDTEKKDG